MFEAAAIDVTDGTHPCFPFLPPDFEEMERTVTTKFIRNEHLTRYSIIVYVLTFSKHHHIINNYKPIILSV